MLNMHQATRTCACFGFTLVAHTLRSIASLILRTSTQPTPVTLQISRASSQCGLYGLVGRAADERHAWRQTWTKGATVHSARSSYLCVKRTSPTLALAARLARVPSASLKRRFTSNFSLVFARLFANLHAYINLALLLCKQAILYLLRVHLTGQVKSFACIRSIHSAFFSNTCSTGHSAIPDSSA